MNDMPNSPGPSARPYGRPLSPHLQIYRWPITMAASITHRATGIALAAGLVLLAWWLLATATGPDAYGLFARLASSVVGEIVLFGFLWSLAYHLLNGIRHLAWDIGYGFRVPTARITAVLVFAGSLLLAAGGFVLALMVKAGLSV
jgi:succinate dehydrogenase / fumarate reductase, cytochrome b subunit